MAKMHMRLNLNLTRKSSEALEVLTEEQELSMTDVVNRAIQLYGFWLEQEKAGNQWFVKKGDDYSEIKIIN